MCCRLFVVGRGPFVVCSVLFAVCTVLCVGCVALSGVVVVLHNVVWCRAPAVLYVGYYLLLLKRDYCSVVCC